MLQTTERRRPSRTQLALLVIIAAAVVAIVVAVTTRTDRTTDLRAGQAPDESSTTTTETTTTEPTSTTSVDDSTTTSTTAGPDSEPAPQTTWTTFSESFQLAANVSATSLDAAEIATFTIRLTDHEGSILRVGIDYGDGTPTGIPGPIANDCTNGDTSAQSATTEKVVTFRHAFRVAGSYDVKLTARSSACGRDERVVETGGTLTALSSTPLTNGPLSPTIQVDPLPDESGGSSTRVLVTSLDLDGFIREVVIDWGDGSEPEAKVFSLEDCIDPERYWQPTQQSVEFSHVYSTGGPSGAIATVATTGCTGVDAQVIADDSTSSSR